MAIHRLAWTVEGSNGLTLSADVWLQASGNTPIAEFQKIDNPKAPRLRVSI